MGPEQAPDVGSATDPVGSTDCDVDSGVTLVVCNPISGEMFRLPDIVCSLFDAIASHYVPVVISDNIELPFEDILDYSELCIFVRAADAIRKGFLLRLLRGISSNEWTRMWRRLKEVAHHFEYQYPSRPSEAVDMIWGAVARKMHSVKMQLHKHSRF